MSWSTSELNVRLAPLNRFKRSSKLLYWPFQGGTSIVDLSCFFLYCVFYVFVRVCSYVLCGHLLGKGWPLGSRLWCLTVSLSHSHWYPGSGVVLDCIDFLSLHPYLLYFIYICCHTQEMMLKDCKYFLKSLTNLNMCTYGFFLQVSYTKVQLDMVHCI